MNRQVRRSWWPVVFRCLRNNSYPKMILGVIASVVFHVSPSYWNNISYLFLTKGRTTFEAHRCLLTVAASTFEFLKKNRWFRNSSPRRVTVWYSAFHTLEFLFWRTCWDIGSNQMVNTFVLFAPLPNCIIYFLLTIDRFKTAGQLRFKWKMRNPCVTHIHSGRSSSSRRCRLSHTLSVCIFQHAENVGVSDESLMQNALVHRETSAKRSV